MRQLWLTLLAISLFRIVACSQARLPETAPSDPSSPGTASPDGPRDPARVDLQTLQGSWQVVSSIWNGVPEPVAAQTVTFLIQGDELIVVDRDGHRFQEGTIKLMADQKPKAIDRFSIDGTQPALGIYSLEGDTFQWCSARGSDNVRPTAFASDPGSKRSLMVLRRIP
jgi:uncharacterized protein (TIGR03067 family)